MIDADKVLVIGQTSIQNLGHEFLLHFQNQQEDSVMMLDHT
jgi:hypothetical protein